MPMKYIKTQSLPRVDDPILNRALEQLDEELNKIARVFIDWTDATQNFKTTGNGELAGLVLGGNFTNPGQPAFLAYNSAHDLNVTGDGTEVTIDFDTEIFDQGGDFAADTFTAPISGRYLLSVHTMLMDLDASTYERVYLQIQTSNRTYSKDWSALVYNNSGWASYELSVVADMDINDTVTCVIAASGGAKSVDVAGGATIFTSFSGALLC